MSAGFVPANPACVGRTTVHDMRLGGVVTLWLGVHAGEISEQGSARGESLTPCTGGCNLQYRRLCCLSM